MLPSVLRGQPPQNRPYTGITYLAQLWRRAAPTDLSDQLLDALCIFVHERFCCIATCRRPHVQLSQRAKRPSTA